jgi:outer membrane lipase/esterase
MDCMVTRRICNWWPREAEPTGALASRPCLPLGFRSGRGWFDMRQMIMAAVVAACSAVSASAGMVTDTYSSFYVLGDSLSDDGNLPGPAWFLATGGSPFAGSFSEGGTFSNGDVWNTPLQELFRDAGQNAENFAVAGATTSTGSLISPGLETQAEVLRLLTDRDDRGDNPLVSLWFGSNDIFDALGSSADVEAAARGAADNLAEGAAFLAESGVADDFLIFNLPDLSRTPRYNLFTQNLADDARKATNAFNEQLAVNILLLEQEGIDIVEIDIFSAFNDLLDDPISFGLLDVTLPCVFPSSAAAGLFGQPTRCSGSTADERLYIDAVHPNRIAHIAISELVLATLQEEIRPPAPVPLPAGFPLLLAGVGGLLILRRRG